MKKLLTLIYCLSIVVMSYAQVPTSSQNFIAEKIFRHPYKPGTNITGKLVDSINVNIQYFDGLGRPLQTVQWQGSPSKKDIVQYIEYDGFGRESKKYLPYAEQNSNNGGYKEVAKANQGNFYQVGGGWDANVIKTPNPYAETVFENSPLNRVLQQGSPGSVWQPAASRTSASGNTVELEYGTNVATGAEAVKLWSIGANNLGASSTNRYYATGKLYKTITKDENWRTGKAGTVEEFKDFEDRVVLKRIWESEYKKLETYYVYDDFGDLRFVIPPGYPSATTTITENNALFNELIYAYKYDERRRLVEKKIPGKGWENIVYNKNDQPILTQDAVQRAAKKWSYIKYDALGRVTETGIYTNTTANQTTRAQVQALATASALLWEDRLQVANYTNHSFPTTGLTPLVINYYDDYTFNGATTATLQVVGITPSQKTKTLLTGIKVFKDDGTAPLLTINYYDDRARLVQSASQNHLGGTDYVTNTYNFVGEILTSKREHKASASGTVTTLLTTNTYDHVGRLKDTKHKVNTQTEVILARNEYNEIGQLKSKKQHSENSGTNFINTTTYSYNERGWTTKATSPHFTYQLNYNTGTSPQYNGNIAQQLWGHGVTTTPNTYSYTYDKLNRLLNGTSTGTVMSEVLTYDDMGNIKTLKRDNGTTTTYNYTVNSVASNRLQSLTGGVTGTYTYDVNGNATKDRTGMTFTYNHLNLPKTATKSGTSVTYVYDAAGAKLRKTAVVNGVTNVRDYVAGIEYTGGNIEMIHTSEGYLQRSGTNYIYHYNLTDHLGNVRTTLQRTSATAGTVIQKHDYYPFGKSKALLASGINKYLYNGKEVQSELGDQQDYGARFYDAEIGRWNVVDNLSELYFSTSSYVYALNNPINAIDPDGNVVIFINGNHLGEGSRNYYLDNRNNSGNYSFYGTRDYWTNGISNFDYAVQKQLNDHSRAIYRDGALGGFFGLGAESVGLLRYNANSAKARSNAGYEQGMLDAGNIISNLAKNSSGEIVETIKIVTHSMGGAYGKGYVKALQKYISGLSKEEQKQIKISLVADFDPYQASSLSAEQNILTQQFTHIGSTRSWEGFPLLANERQKGLSDDNYFMNQMKSSHSIFSFFDNIRDLKEGTYKWNGNLWELVK